MLSLLLGAARPGLAKPDLPTCDPAMLATAQLALAEACPCDTAANHGRYVSCAAHWAFRSVHDGTLPRACRRIVRRATVQSTCGKPSFVTCCRQGVAGTRCVVKTESQCLHLAGTVGATASCVDACTGSPSGAFLAPAASLF